MEKDLTRFLRGKSPPQIALCRWLEKEPDNLWFLTILARRKSHSTVKTLIRLLVEDSNPDKNYESWAAREALKAPVLSSDVNISSLVSQLYEEIGIKRCDYPDHIPFMQTTFVSTKEEQEDVLAEIEQESGLELDLVLDELEEESKPALSNLPQS